MDKIFEKPPKESECSENSARGMFSVVLEEGSWNNKIGEKEPDLEFSYVDGVCSLGGQKISCEEGARLIIEKGKQNYLTEKMKKLLKIDAVEKRMKQEQEKDLEANKA